MIPKKLQNVAAPASAVLCAVFALSALAKPRTPKNKPGVAAPEASPEAAQAPEARPDKAELQQSSARLLERAQQLFTDLEYDAVLPIAKTILERDDVSLDQKIEVYRLYASSLVIVQDPLEGARLFRLLVRARPGYKLPPDTPLKISQVFLQVSNEEVALAAQAQRFQRELLVRELRLIGEPPDRAEGGRALPFAFRLRDSGNAVEDIQVGYRRKGQVAYSSLALLRDPEGMWRGQIPAEFTSDPSGFQLEYFIETSDSKGPLLVLGTAAKPLTLAVTPGTIDSRRPPPISRAVFFGGVGVTTAAGLSAAALGFLFNTEQSRFRQLSGDVSGLSVVSSIQRGNTLAAATTGALITFAATALITGLLIPFVNWSNQ